MASLDDTLHKEAIDADREKAGYNDFNIFWHSAQMFSKTITSRYANLHADGRSNPIELYEYDLRELWYKYIQGARITAADHPAQDGLVSQVLQTREMGVLSAKLGGRKDKGVGEIPEMDVATTSDGNIWSDLPFLVQEIRVAWTISTSFPVVQRHNLSAFIARLAGIGVCNPELCLVAIWILRDTLETPQPLTKRAEPTDSNPKKQLASIADLLPAAMVWFQYCGYKIASLCILNQNIEPGLSETGKLAKDTQIIPSSGLSMARWIFWRDRLEELSRCGNEEVEQFALEALRTVKFWGGRIESMDVGHAVV
jgi:hypothetical protein